MTTTDAIAAGPWPGPMPYDEQHRNAFHGRDAELREVKGRLLNNRLVMMTAWSGIGKTSFLRAGVVPYLRAQRHKALVAQEPKAQPAVLVLRDWIDARSATADDLVSNVLRDAIEAMPRVASLYADDAGIKDSIEQDASILASVQRHPSAYKYIAALAEAAGALTLVLDQFEEALQTSSAQTAGLLDLIAQIYRHQLNVRLIVSFREEFLSHVMRLGTELDSLGALVYRLDDIKMPTLRAALVASASEGGVTLGERALDELMSWLQDGRTGGRVSAAAERPQIAREASIDLLKLQAVLVDLMDEAGYGRHGHHTVEIDSSVVQKVKESAERAAGRKLTGSEVVEFALERFVDRRVLPRPRSIETTDGIHAGISPDDIRLLEHRRAGARMAEFFSTGTLKVPQSEGPLVARTWREEWLVLGTTAELVEQALTEAPEASDAEAAALLDLPTSPPEDDAGVLSGYGRRSGWSPQQAAEHLIRISRETLRKLEDGNVLRPKNAANGITFELVHDGFGPALVAWAEEMRQTPIDTLAASVAQRGQECNWRRLTGAVEDASWRGCWVGPATPSGQMILENVNFNHCDLRGTLFERCVFRGGSFSNTDLDFVIFQDCVFEGGTEAPFLFEDVRATGLTFHGGAATHVHFKNCTLYKMWWSPLPSTGGGDEDFDLCDVSLVGCTLSQWTADNIKINPGGTLSIIDSGLSLCDLFGLTPYAASLEVSGSRFVYCPLNRELEEAIRGHGNSRYPVDIAPENWKDINPESWRAEQM